MAHVAFLSLSLYSIPPQIRNWPLRNLSSFVAGIATVIRSMNGFYRGWADFLHIHVVHFSPYHGGRLPPSPYRACNYLPSSDQGRGYIGRCEAAGTCPTSTEQTSKRSNNSLTRKHRFTGFQFLPCRRPLYYHSVPQRVLTTHVFTATKTPGFTHHYKLWQFLIHTSIHDFTIPSMISTIATLTIPVFFFFYRF